MAFTVENGTGLSNSNSYESVLEFEAYCSEQGQPIAAQYTPTAKEQALIRAAQYIDLTFGHNFKGRRLVVTQAMRFPRYGLPDPEFCGVYIEGIPNNLKYAQSEYALLELEEPGFLMKLPEVDDSGMQIQTKYEKVGPIEERITYVGSAPSLRRPIPKADALLRDYLNYTGARSHRA